VRRELRLVALMMLAPAAGQAACTVSASGVMFGVYDQFSGSPTDVTGAVTLTCTAGSGSGAYTIALSTGGGGSYSGRMMTSGSNTVAYQAYANAARTAIWGDGTGGSGIVNGIDNLPSVGGTHVYHVFGRMNANLIPNYGAYTDTISVTVNY
jgi:spore coat protein U-like protein